MLTQGKKDNAGRRKIDRKDEQVFELNHYILYWVLIIAAIGYAVVDAVKTAVKK